MGAIPQWEVEVAESSFEARRETRTAEIQRQLLELEAQRLVNGSLVGKALRIIRLPVERLTGTYRALDELLEKLRRDKLTVGDFTERWYQLDQDSIRMPSSDPAPAPTTAESAPQLLTLLPSPAPALVPVRQRAMGATDAPKPTMPESRTAPGGQPWTALLGTRLGLVSILAAVFVVNYFQTAIEEWIKRQWGNAGLGAWLLGLGETFTRASHELEGRLSFGAHDATSLSSVYGYTAAYFFVFPLMCLAVAAVLYQRPGISPLRVLTLAVTFDYAVSLPFFLLFPVVERWTWAESDAILLSDLWSSGLIDAMRPISGLDNCFPSFHCSMTVILILLSYAYDLRGRAAVLSFGLVVILSTFVLGIHWIPDMVAGGAVAVLSVAVAQKIDRRLTASNGVPAKLTEVGGTELTEVGGSASRKEDRNGLRD